MKYTGSILFVQLVTFFLIQCNLLQRSVKIAPVTFDYKAISNNYFSPNQSKPFPLTVQRGNNLYNSTTIDGRYLFYATDQKGNYDIWFRDLQSSVVVPVTNSPFSESKPSISPDGKYLVYVSEEFDSSGDLILLEMDIEEWTKELLEGNRFINQDTINLTNLKSKGEYSKQQIVDTDPVWSPDGKYVLFVSDRFSPGLPNLVVINPRKPEEIFQLTADGGVNPSFSAKGDYVYYISYKDDPRGEIYQLRLSDKSISRLTENNYLDYSPSVDAKNSFLYYSSIRTDTNLNGRLDERDTNLLVMRNLQTGRERVLSSGEASYFDVRYSNFNGGSILFSAPYFNSINIYFIPENGSVPRQNSIAEQYQYTKAFQDKQSLDSYFLGLDSIELFHSEDPLFPIYSARAKALKAQAFEKMGKSSEAKLIFLEMRNQKISPNSVFEIGYGRWLLGNPSSRNEELKKYISLVDSETVSLDTIPSLMHILIDEYEHVGMSQLSSHLIAELNEKFPDYHQIREIRRRLGGYEFTKDSKSIPNVYRLILANWHREKERFLQNPQVPFSTDSKRDLRYALEDMTTKIESGRNPEEVIAWTTDLLQNPEMQKEVLIQTTLQYLKAKALAETRKFAESNTVIDSIVPIPINIDLEPPGKPTIFEMTAFQVAYKNPILLRSNLLKYQNQKSLGNTSDALRNMKIYLEFYDPVLGVDLKVEEIQNAFLYFENKALEFERLGNLLQSSFHYFFNNQNMFLVKTRNLYLDSLYKEYAVYYQRKMVDTIFDYGKKLREEEEKALLNQLNILGKDKLNVIGNITDLTSVVTDNKYLRSVVDLKDLEQIEVLSSEALRWTELYYKQAVPRARPHLDLATLYGYAYFLINKYVIYESYYYATDTMTDARKKEILENYKKAEWELKWIIFAEPTYYDAYQLLGWLYQYIDLIKLRKTDTSSETDEEMYLSLYKRFFPEKNLEGNVELYSQILVFLDEGKTDPKVLSDLNLNLGNNYFLLNNYPKANERYTKVEETSKLLLSKNQFEGYRREAVFRYNFGRSLIYQGLYTKAIEQFELSIQLYFKNEYYQAVNLQASEDSQVNRDKLANVRSKLALLFSLKGLSELESQRYAESIVSFQTAIAYNNGINFVNPINLYNYLAIAFQKAGRFRNSYEMLTLAKSEYEKSRPNFLTRLKSVYFWNFLLSADSRVIGEGRFPGEFPDDFKYLLGLGVGIENHIEQREYSLALSELEKRNNFILDKSLDKTIMGRSILAKSKQIAAQIHYENRESDLAVESFEELIELVKKPENKDPKEKVFSGYAASVFSFVESNANRKEEALSKVRKLISELDSWKQAYIGNCAIVDCELSFRRSNIRYDITKGIAYYYLGELIRDSSKENAMESYATAAELLENPGEVNPSEIGLAGDPLKRKERIRLLYNLAAIYDRLGDILLSDRKLKEASELAYEFRLEEESFWINNLKLELLLRRKSIPKVERSSQIKSVVTELENAWQSKPELRLFSRRTSLDKFGNLLSDYYLVNEKYEIIPSIWEEIRNIYLFRDAMGSQFEFEDSKLNLAYADIVQWMKNYKKIISSLEEKTQRRENIVQINGIRDRENKKFPVLLAKIKEMSPARFAFFHPNERPEINFPDAWLGIYKWGRDSLFIQSQKSKLEIRLCEPTNLNTCGLKIIPEKIFVQGIGSDFSKADVDEIQKFLLLDGKSISFIFDRSHVKLFDEKNERNWKWTTLLADKKIESSSSNVRIPPTDELGSLLYDTDILVSSKLRKMSGSLFGDEISQRLPLREIFSTSGSEISIVGLHSDEMKAQSDWNRLGYLYEVLRSKRIQNLVSYSSKDVENALLSGKPDLTSLNRNPSVYLFGNWQSNEGKGNLKARLEEFLKKGSLFEKDKDYTEAYNQYYTASTLLENSDPRLPELELKLANLKVELFPSIAKHVFYEPLLKKYNEDDLQNRIRYQYFVSCYSDKDIRECEKLKQSWQGSSGVLYAKAFQFYTSLRFGKVSKIAEFNKARAELESNEDQFIQSYRLGTLYIQNYLFKEAEKELSRSYQFAKTPKEKNITKNRELEILFHKGLLFGDKGIHLTNLTSTSAYSLGFRKLWKEYDQKIYSREFTKFGYADSIYDLYRKKMYEGWKDQQNKGYFDPLMLTPEYLTSGSSVLEKLSHLNRTLMFSLLKRSIELQKKNEVNALISLLLKEETSEKRPMRALTFRLLQAEKLYLRGEIEAADELITQFEKEYEDIGFGNSFLDDYYTNLKYKTSYIFEKGNPDDYYFKSEISSLYPKIKSSSPENYIPLLNELMKTLKSEYLSENLRTELDFVFLYMLKQSLQKNSSETFFDVAIARDRLGSYSERYFGEKVFIRDLPRFDLYSERLKKRLPKNQELTALIDVGKKTYTLSFMENKSSGRELFVDNKEVTRDVLRYFVASELGGLETLLRDSVSDRYRNSIRLAKGRRHYLYVSGFHAKVPINFPDIELYHVSSISNFIDNPFLKKSKIDVYDGVPGLNYDSTKLGPDEKIRLDLIAWELGAKRENKSTNIDNQKIDWNQNSFVEYADSPIGKISLNAKRGMTYFANNKLGEKTFYSNDFFNLSYFVGTNVQDLYLLHSGIQTGSHNIKFTKRFFEKFEGRKPIQVRLDEAKEAARVESPEDRYWTGYRLYTSAIIEDN
ncbi:biopolymer transporter TolR [Leptospira ognonensis]|uniref:biopolymer transporter TolR n=1 Tax=Leptospira ognonensis TaxID=2484945 RepID=UPI001FE50EAB|nr:biopolymer transporter TolR [Leptospira ognonensis]